MILPQITLRSTASALAVQFVLAAPSMLLGDEETKTALDHQTKGHAKDAISKVERAAVAQIVFSHKDAPNALAAGKNRSKEEARERAEKALAKARTEGVKFEELVKEFSDDPDGARNGGRMGVFERHNFRGPYKAVADALFELKVGEVSDIIETDFGLHILRRLPVVEYCASHILIQYEGCEGTLASVKRTRAEAETLASKVLAELTEGGIDFAEGAKKYSEDRGTRRQGGSIGIFAAGRMVPEFEDALDSLEVGEIGGPFETRYGFHVIRRDKIERVRIHQILIQYKGCRKIGEKTPTRGLHEAKKLADELLAKLKEGADFAELAKQYSDGPAAAVGGHVGLHARGEMVPKVVDAAFELKVGEVSKLVRSRFGFHIILRTE